MRIRTLEVGPLAVNCYLLESAGCAVAVDAGGEPGRILKALEDDGVELSAVLCTHGHFDHVGGCREVVEATGADLLIHRADEHMLEEAPAAAEGFGCSLPQPPPPSGYLADGGHVDFGDRRLEVIHTPGHSPGGVCLAAEGILLTGDLIFAGSVGRTDLPGGSAEQLARSAAAVLGGRPPETRILPGHGPASTVGRELRENPWLRGMGG